MGDPLAPENNGDDELVRPKNFVMDVHSIGELFSSITLITKHSAIDEFSVKYDFTASALLFSLLLILTNDRTYYIIIIIIMLKKVKKVIGLV